jgi:NAD(P)-dependent dehydrogenase (short-subunit alcohol dehydrogenase family)
MDDFTGKIALVTGGAGGIGSAISAELVARGARVAIADIDLARAEGAAAALGGKPHAIALRLDVTDPQEWLSARETLERESGPLDILVSNAGVNYTGSLDTIDPEAWLWVYNVNFMGSLHAVRTFLPGMKERGRQGHVVLTSSITALHPFATQGAYTTAKAALLNFGTVLKQELAGTPIGVSVVCPGIVSTGLRENAAGARPDKLKAADAPVSSLSTKLGMAPQFVGAAVVDAVANDQFFVFTHADYAASIRSDRDLMLAAMDQSADPDYHEPEAFLAPLPR